MSDPETQPEAARTSQPEPNLTEVLAAALARREPLFAACRAEQTDCYRLLHGSAEGIPGLTLDRYGPQLLIQSFHKPLSPEGLEQIQTQIRAHFEPGEVIYHDRSAANSRYKRDRAAESVSHIGHELGVSYLVQGEHGGQDPLLFLDLRVGRRHVLANAAGKSVLNFFAYTCGLGICAAIGGATEVWNVDFAASALEIGRRNAALNGLAEGEQLRFVQSDYFTAARQLAGLPVNLRRGKSVKPYERMQTRSFDLVCLDPPHWAKSPFGTVDLVRDYQSVLKPAVMATAEGGSLLCTNNVAKVPLADWLGLIERCAIKAGRTPRSIAILKPEADFPSPDDRHPLKIAVMDL